MPLHDDITYVWRTLVVVILGGLGGITIGWGLKAGRLLQAVDELRALHSCALERMSRVEDRLRSVEEQIVWAKEAISRLGEVQVSIDRVADMIAGVNGRLRAAEVDIARIKARCSMLHSDGEE